MKYNKFIEVTANEKELNRLRENAVPIKKVLCLKNRLFTNGGVYIIFRNDRPAYVGKTTRPLRTRLREHMSESVYSSLLGEFLNKSLEPFTISIVDDEAAKRIMNGYTGDVEFFLINTLRPEFNRHFLLPGKLTGEAKRQQLRLQREREKRYEFRRKSSEFFIGELLMISIIPFQWPNCLRARMLIGPLTILQMASKLTLRKSKEKQESCSLQNWKD